MAQRLKEVLNAIQAVERYSRWWFQNKQKSAQHWYITFCLLMSALQDRLTGVTLMHNGNLNWSVTAHYYSMVHAARMLCFLKFGDFPMSHASLQKAFSPERNYPVCFNWLYQFSKDLQAVDGPNSVNVWISDIGGILDPDGIIGASFSALGKLRNDSNYEALLIVHEQGHVYVTERFQALARLAQMASASTVDYAVASYVAAIDEGFWNQWSASKIKDVSNNYVRLKLLPDLRSKFGENEEADSILSQLEQSLVRSCDYSPITDDDAMFENALRMKYFECKKTLMQSFNDKISQLSRLEQVDDQHS